MTVLELMQRRANFRPSSINEENWTVEVIAATATPVKRGGYSEVLAIGPDAISISGDQIPVLDAHRQDGLDRVLGRVISHRFEDGQLIATLQISKRHPGIWQDVKSGLLPNVSVGYAPIAQADATINGERVRTLTKWRLHEISFVPIGADPSARVRSGNMPDDIQAAEPQTTEVENRAEVTREVRSLARAFDLGHEWADQIIDSGISLESARASAMTVLQTRQAAAPIPRVSIGQDHNDPQAILTRAIDGFHGSRVSGEVPEASREFAHMSIADFAKQTLQTRGISTTGLSADAIISRSLQTTSDLPNLLTGVGNRVLGEQYASAQSPLKSLTRKRNAKDFRAMSVLKLDTDMGIEQVNEHGEFKSGSMVESKEAFRIKTYGRITGISRQAMLNDDLGALNDIFALLGREAADFESEQIIALLESNSGNGPTMDDGDPLFHANHGNKASSGAAMGTSTFSAGRLAMRGQRSPAGRLLNVVPKWLIVPRQLETAGEVALTSVNVTEIDNANPFAARLKLMVEPRLSSATRWYLSDDWCGLIHSYLSGSEGPQTESRVGFEVDGVQFKIRLDWGVGALDHRFMWHNAGQ